jgi:hypothetical protein
MIHSYFGMGAASPAADKARLRACREFKALLSVGLWQTFYEQRNLPI